MSSEPAPTAARPDPILPPDWSEWLAERFHTVYEQMAPAFNYSTREESARPWADVPKRNKMLMRAVAAIIEDDMRDRLAGEVQVVAMQDVEWLREHATDDKDRARLIGAEDAYRAAIKAINGGDHA